MSPKKLWTHDSEYANRIAFLLRVPPSVAAHWRALAKLEGRSITLVVHDAMKEKYGAPPPVDNPDQLKLLLPNATQLASGKRIVRGADVKAKVRAAQGAKVAKGKVKLAKVKARKR